jgi:hypothetical protein
MCLQDVTFGHAPEKTCRGCLQVDLQPIWCLSLFERRWANGASLLSPFLMHWCRRFCPDY